MGAAYTLSLFDPRDTPCKGVDTRRLHDVNQVVDLLQLLERYRPGPNPRFSRLLALLDRAHPGHGVKFSGRIDGEEMQASADAGQRFGPGADQAVMRLRIDLDQCDLGAVMPDLLFWSRELGLDVFDELQGIFLPWRALPVPRVGGMEFARRSGWWRPLKTWSSALELRQVLIDRLTHLLVGHGYEFREEPGYDAVFERKIDDGFQRIAAYSGGQHPALTCQFLIKQGSRRFTQAMHQAGYPLDNPADTRLILHQRLAFFRWRHHPGWPRLFGYVHQVWTQGWLDWMLEDLGSLVLPVLDLARSPDGLNALYNEPAYAASFPGAVGEDDDAVILDPLPPLAAASVAGSPHFDRLVLRIMKQQTQADHPGTQDIGPEQVRHLVAVLRASEANGTGTSA